MGSLGSAEILVIAVAALIVFGPKRLPEIARKASEILLKTREATKSVTSALDTEFEGVAAPLQSLKAEYDATVRDIKGAATSVGDVAMGTGDTSTSKKKKKTDNAEPEQDMAVTIPLDDDLPGEDATTASRESAGRDMAVTIPLDDDLPGQTDPTQDRPEGSDTEERPSTIDDAPHDEGATS